MNIIQGKLGLCAALLATGGTWSASTALADGTETLGTPSVAIATGSRFITAGVGLDATQPGDLVFNVPAGNSIEQVLIYWDGADTAPAGGPPVLGTTQDTISVGGNSVTGKFIGGRTAGGGTQFYAFRADITALGVVTTGDNTIPVSGLDFDQNNGAGILVLVDDGTVAHIDLVDGNDRAYFASSDVPAEQTQETVKQTFTFASATEDRNARLPLIFADVSGTSSGGGFRPTVIEVQVGALPVLEFNDLLDSVDGDEWDTIILDIAVPAGETQVTVQAFSKDNGVIPDAGNPASFDWLAAGLSIRELPFVSGRMTGGGRQIRVGNARITRGFTIHCDITLSNNIQVNWHRNRWHLDKPITSALCIDDPTLEPFPPDAPFDTFIGEGVGRLNNVDGSVIRFTFVDAGEPGRNDQASIKIWAPGDNPDVDDPVLDVSGVLDRGNIQAHYDQPHK